MKINKTIKGELIPYRVLVIPNTMTVDVRYWSDDKPIIGKITHDLEYIVLPDDFLSPYLDGYGKIKVGKLKINKRLKREIKELNNL